MSRTEQTQTAVLGALSVMPMTGYALREEIRSVLGHFWSESFGQIYPALAELQRQGLVERTGADQVRASVFAITPAGTARLRELLSEPAQPVRPRNGLMLRLFFGRQLGPEACRNLIREAREEAEARLAELAVARSESQEGPHAQDRPYWLLTISAGEHAARAAIAWADDALEALETLPDSAAPNPAAEPPAVSETVHPAREHP
ncbi:PadR family transcriptional regulator [Arthrobacter sp. MSA 4-2]|uniref:PadR family transcriptional regulator n=1 Tax=Arthrobacter sp. MSA 4-2 TaxID=2794349 RepID=UPI0018E76CB6|nr:PadR family transcriptional regulator [Arthrobacter sp. MSA 4-2]MBJ2120136.1 PadR family transcriptional regulator [Arthrobacter sp. MSA 4-2]